MRTIAVLGANGQVGAELCLLLAALEDVRVIPVVRSELGTAYLAQCGLACRVGSTRSAEEIRSLLADADLVADLSYPRGQPSQVRDAIREVLTNSIRHAPAGAALVYASSTMAFGMPPAATRYRHHVVARTLYAAQKRYAERLAIRLGREQRRPVFVLRLGQVHGEIQSISRELRLATASGSVALRGGGAAPSDTVFCSTLALALRNIAHGLEAPGTYTLLESPEWTWRQIFEHYAEVSGAALRVVAAPEDARSGVGVTRRAARAVTSLGANLAVRHRELWNAQVLPVLSRLPGLEQLDQRLRGPYLRRRVAREIRTSEPVYAPACIDGPVPGSRLQSLGDSRAAMEQAARSVRALLEERFGPESHNFPVRPR